MRGRGESVEAAVTAARSGEERPGPGGPAAFCTAQGDAPPRRLNILFAIWRYHPNNDGLVLGLVEAGHGVAFLVHHKDPTERYVDGVPVTLVPQSRLAGLVRLLRRRADRWHQNIVPSLRFVTRYLREARPDLVIARDVSLTNYALFLACRCRGIDYLLYTQERSGFEPLSPRRMRLLALGLWPRHTMNTTIAAPPGGPVAGKTYDFVPFSISARDFEKPAYPAGPPLRLLAVGKLDSPRKNHVPLVRSLAPVLRAGSVTLTILGLRAPEVTQTFQALLDAIAEEGVGPHVTLREGLHYDDSRRLYEEHDLFVMVSSQESAGISPVEAMVTGLPVIVGSDVGTKYLVEEGETGFVFEDGDFDAFAARVRHFLKAPSEVERMGRAARARMLEDYSPAAFERRLMDLVARRFPHLLAEGRR